MKSHITLNDPLVEAFENGTLNIREFDHKKHLYIAWIYLSLMSFDEALERYVKFLCAFLFKNGYLNKFSLKITEHCLKELNEEMVYNPEATFEELAKIMEIE